jgi:hypothetical protein
VPPAACPRCQMLVTARTPRVVTSEETFHRECYEAWYFARTGRYPRLQCGFGGDRDRYELRPVRSSLGVRP